MQGDKGDQGDPGDPATDTDDQLLSVTATDLVISDGNSISLTSIQDGVDDADNDITPRN